VKRIARLLSGLILLILIVIMTAECQWGGSSGMSSPPRDEIQASEILAKIKNGMDVEYSHVVIKGDLDLRQLGLPVAQIDLRKNPYTSDIYPDYNPTRGGGWISRNVARFLSKISIEDSIVEGNIDMGYTVFMKPVNFQLTRFNGNVYFTHSIFIEDVNFKGASFREPAIFEGAQFNKNADFASSNFAGSASFAESIFDGNADFHGSNFNKSADFSRIQFNNDAYFGYSGPQESSTYGGSYVYDIWPLGTGISGYSDIGMAFSGFAEFSYSNFKGIADFGERQFNQNAYFRSTTFNELASFNKAIFGNDSYFSSTIFSKGVDFNMSQFKGNTFFEGTEFFEFMDLTKITFSRLDIYWPSGTLLICSDGLTYLNLIRNFRDLEHFELADEIYYQYRHWRQDQTSWLDGNKYIDLLAWLSCGYGVRPLYPIYWGGILILAFGIIYWKFEAVQRSNKQYYRITYAAEYKTAQSLSFNKGCLDLLKRIRERFSTSSSLSFSDAFYFSSMIFFVSHPPTDWRPSDRSGGWKYVIMIEDILGWLLLTLFVVTLTRVMIRP